MRGLGDSSRRRFLAAAGLAGGSVLGVFGRSGFLRPAAGEGPQPPIHPRDAWGLDLPPRGPMESEQPGDVRFLLVHHTAGANGYPPESVRSTLRSVYQYHTGPKGWHDIAYNFLVDAYGGIWEGRHGSLTSPIKGDATGGSQGYAQLCSFVGDHRTTPPTIAAASAMAQLLAWLAGRNSIDLQPGATAAFVSRGSSLHPAGAQVITSTIAAHREMSATTCPGDAGYRALKGQIAPTAAALAAGSYPPLKEVFAFGNAPDLQSTAGQPLAVPIVGMASSVGAGYWLVASDGGVFAYGDARFLGSTGGTTLNRPVVGMAATPTGNGYWLVASDGGIFAYGDARFLGSTGGTTLVSPIVGMDSSISGNGYRLVAGDGGVFCYGDAAFLGRPDAAILGSRRSVGITTFSGGGYWVATTR